MFKQMRIKNHFSLLFIFHEFKYNVVSISWLLPKFRIIETTNIELLIFKNLSNIQQPADSY